MTLLLTYEPDKPRFILKSARKQIGSLRQERIARIAELRRQGKSLQAIADVEGLSPTQVIRDLKDLKATVPCGGTVEPEAKLLEETKAKLRDDQAWKLQRLLLEKARRRIEAIKLLVPMPGAQTAFAESKTKERLLISGNRCLAGETEIYDPVLKCNRRIDSINSNWHVLAWNHGKVVVAKASVPFIKGTADLYEVKLANGNSFVATMDHVVLTNSGWQSISQLADAVSRNLHESELFLLPSNSDTYLSTSRQDDRHCTRTLEDFPVDYRHGHHFYDERLRLEARAVRAVSRQLAYAPEHIQKNWPSGVQDDKEERTLFCRWSDRLSIQCVQDRISDLYDASLFHDELILHLRPSGFYEASRRSVEQSSHPVRNGVSFPRPAIQENSDVSVLHPSSSRRIEPCRSSRRVARRFAHNSFRLVHKDDEPRRNQTSAFYRERRAKTYVVSIKFARRDVYYDLTVPIYHNYLAQSIFHHNSGKTLAACWDVARIVTGQDPLNRLPKTDGVCYIVGRDQKELAEVLYRKLFRAGAFKIIRDEVTGVWRSFMPNEPQDACREHEAKPAPPLIPNRFIKSIAWEKKKKNQPQVIILNNGWEIHFFSSQASPPHGSSIHLAHFDEEVVNPQWYPEIAARLVDHAGYFIWSATPQVGTDLLYDLHERAELDLLKDNKKRRIEEFCPPFEENIHLTAEQKEDFKAKLTLDELAVRVGGEFALQHSRVFPEYQKAIHEIDWFDIPKDWTIYVAVDPGRQVCAGLLCAIPPFKAPEEGNLPEEYFGDYAYLFDEIYIEGSTAEMFAEQMAQKSQGYDLEAMIIDHTEGRKYETGSGVQIEEVYAQKLAKHKVSCRRTGSRFTSGIANPKAGVEMIRDWLRVREDGTCKLRVIGERLPKFNFEITRYRYKRNVKGRMSDEPEDKGACHAMACLRYLVQDNPVYLPPRRRKAAINQVWLAAREIKKKQTKNQGVLHLGPGIGA